MHKNVKAGITILICLVCFLFIGFGIQPKMVAAAGSTYYVATTGSDTTGTGTLANPWATPQHAAKEMTAGNTCYIEAGTYTGTINGRLQATASGTAGNYITFENYNGGVVNLDASGAFSTIDTGITTPENYLQFIGLNVIGPSYAGLDYSGSNNINIINCTFTNTQDGGIYCATGDTASNIVINGCTCNGTNTEAIDEALTINNTNNFTIEHCLIENPVADPRCDIGIGVGCTNGVISGNTVANCSGLGIYVSCMGVSMSNIAIYDNAVYNCAEGGIGLSDEDAATDSGVTLTNVNIYNNLIYGNARGFRVDQYGNGTTTGSMFNFSFINNTLYNNGTASEIFLDNTPQYFSNCIIRNNILMNTLSAGDSAISYSDYAGGGVTVDHNLEYNSFGSWGPNIAGASCITTNPELINPTSNFALQATSPAINAGSATGAPSTDYVGTARPQAGGYDIGAYEYVVSTPSSPPGGTASSFGYNAGSIDDGGIQNGSINFGVPGYVGSVGTGVSMSVLVSNADSSKAHNIILGIYTHSGSTYNLVAQTGSLSIPAGAAKGWVTGNLTTSPSLTTTTYYLCIQTDSPYLHTYYDAISGYQQYYYNQPFNSFPSSFSSPINNKPAEYGIEVNYLP